MKRTLTFQTTDDQDVGIAASFADQQAFLIGRGEPPLVDDSSYLVSRLLEQCDGFSTAVLNIQITQVVDAIKADPTTLAAVQAAAQVLPVQPLPPIKPPVV